MGVSESFDPVEAFSEAARDAARRLDGRCDLCVLFAGAPHLPLSKWILSAVHDETDPANLIGCGAGGLVGGGREIEEGPGAVVWAASMPDAEISTHHFRVEPEGDDRRADRSPRQLGEDCLILLADPYTFSTEALLARLNEVRPDLPVLGGLASAAVAGGGTLFRDGDVLAEGAVTDSRSPVCRFSCVSQGAAPVGPEMTITAAEDNVIHELASRPAIERLTEAIAALPEREQEGAGA